MYSLYKAAIGFVNYLRYELCHREFPTILQRYLFVQRYL